MTTPTNTSDGGNSNPSESVNTGKAFTREELFLKAIATGEETPAPLTRKEHILKSIAESGGGSSGGGKAIYLTPTIDGDTLRLGKTYNEIVDFAENGNTIWGVFDSMVGSGVNMILLTKYSHENNRYSASFIADTIKLVFTASSPTNELVINKNA